MFRYADAHSRLTMQTDTKRRVGAVNGIQITDIQREQAHRIIRPAGHTAGSGSPLVAYLRCTFGRWCPGWIGFLRCTEVTQFFPGCQCRADRYRLVVLPRYWCLSDSSIDAFPPR